MRDATQAEVMDGTLISELLAQYAGLMNHYGPDGVVAEKFFERYMENEEFCELALTAYWLKKTLIQGKK